MAKCYGCGRVALYALDPEPGTDTPDRAVCAAHLLDWLAIVAVRSPGEAVFCYYTGYRRD